MGKGKGKGKFEVNEYRMSMHVGVCLQADALTAIYIGEKVAWSGLQTSAGSLYISAPSLFGGNKKEGGVSGTVEYLPGAPDQVLPDYLAMKLGRASGADCPGFRGLTSLFFTGASYGGGYTGGVDYGNEFTEFRGGYGGGFGGGYGSYGTGFTWISNNPYMKDIWVGVRRAPKGLNASTALVPRDSAVVPVSGSELLTGEDANPAHIIYECLTNQEWGMGAPASLIDVAAFNNAADALLLEGLGLSMVWTRQTTIEAFVSEVLDHINAMLFINPRNGLMTLKLVRGDYNVDDLREITVDNAKLTNFQRKAWGEIINEVVVTWTNPENEQDETVVIHDNAAIASQGGIVSDNRNYYGVRSSALAMKLAARDLRVSSTPLATCECEANRGVWDIIPGEVVLLTWPDRGLNEVPMRVGPVDYGKPGQMQIKFSLLEDIFGYATTDYSAPPETGWVGGSETALPMEYAKVITVPSFFAANYLPQTTGGLADIQYPEVIGGVLATSETAFSYEIYGDDVSASGTLTQKTLATNTVAGYATTIGALAQEATSTFVGFSGFKGKVAPDNSVFVFIGGSSVGDAASEIAIITAFDTNSFTLRRGILDTVPRAWPAGTPCYFVQLDSNISDLVIRSDAEAVTYKLLSRVVGGVLAVTSAPTLTGTLNDRPHRPLRPANVKVNNIGVGPVNLDGLTTVPITWSNRNRTMENSQVVYWDDATTAPEAGQTTKITLLTEAGALIVANTGISGNSYALATSQFGTNSRGIIRVSSQRDGFDSLQHYDIPVVVQSGYGLQYGMNYGGGSGYTEQPPVVADSYEKTAWWNTFNEVTGTPYSALTLSKFITVAAGDMVTATADIYYQNLAERTARLGLKCQFKLVGTAVWNDFSSVVYGTDATGEGGYVGGNVLEQGTAVDGQVSINQTVTGVPAGDYEIQFVANVSVGGTTLRSTGIATVTAA